VHKSAIKKNYIEKSPLFISLLFVMSLGLIGGCSDGGRQNNSQALTENDFAEDSSLRVDLGEGVIVTFLESPMSEETENDTGTLGVDEIPVAYKRTTEQTFCWEDDDVDAMHFMELRDSEGNVVLTIEANGDCVEEVIEKGDYSLSIHHDGSNEDSLPIFLIPSQEELEQARETEGFIDGLKLVASNILKRIERTVTKDAQALEIRPTIMGPTLIQQYITENYTHRCDFCSLERADFSGRDLSGTDLSGADLRHASLIVTNLSGADLTGADLRRAFLLLTDFSGATWCDGTCVCAQGSIDTCNGCAPLEEVCTGR
jgi:hypothetical protein